MIRLYWSFRTIFAWTLAAAAFAVFAITDPAFGNPGNLLALMQAFSSLALIAVALGAVMIAGEFDLSIAGVLPLSGVIAVKFAESNGLIVGIALALVMAILVGLVNGWIATRFRVPSLAVTVGTLVFTVGVGFALADSKMVAMTDYSVALWLDGAVLEVLSPRILLLLGLVVCAWLVLSRTWFGIRLRSVGADAERSLASGVSVRAVLIPIFLAASVLTSVVGITQGLTLASGSPSSSLAALLQAVTAAIIGGVSLSGGRGSVVGIVAGALLLAVVSNGLSLQGASTASIQLINGSLLLFVVIVDRPLDGVVTRAVDRQRARQAAIDDASMADPVTLASG